MTGASLLPSRLQAPAVLGGASAGAGVGAGAGDDGPDLLPPDGFDLPDLGVCKHQPVLLLLLFDNSPSVAGGNDAVGNRFGEAAIALAHCRRRCRCGRELVAIRTFDRRTSADVGPVHMDGAGWPRIAAGLAAPAEIDEGSSRLRPALLDAGRLAHEHPLHETALVVFSDFQLLDLFPDRVLHRLCRFPGRVHAIVLAAEPPAPLLAGPVTVSRISAGSRPGEVARAVVAALGEPAR